MKSPSIARILGIVFLLAGIAGFVPFVTAPAGPTADYITIGANYGFLAGIFPVNLMHDAVHLIFGIWGIGASFAFAGSVRYLRSVAWLYLIAVILGAIPITNTLFGIMPVYGHDIWLHALIVIAAAYAGYGPPSIPSEDEGGFEGTPAP